MLSLLRRLRHGPLAGLGPIWTFFGASFRKWARATPILIRRRIGPYGPFRLDATFAFSDFDNWGRGHNKAFGICIEACRGKTCVLDVGAHVGLVTLSAASVLGPGGRLFAFEPSAANSRMLRRHLAANGFSAVTVVDAIVGSERSDGVPFFESLGPHGQNSVVFKGEKVLLSEEGGYARVLRPQTTLDAFCDQHGCVPEVIKIDVEGAEISVLEGARRTLDRCRPLLILSVHPREISLTGKSLDDLRRVLSELRYEIQDVDGRVAAELRSDEYVVIPREMPRLQNGP